MLFEFTKKYSMNDVTYEATSSLARFRWVADVDLDIKISLFLNE